MMGRKDKKPLTSVSGSTTLIAKETTIRGDIEFCGNLDVEGKIVGSIMAEHGKEVMLRVLDGGSVEGEIRVSSAIINGTVTGDIHSSERLELAEKAKINGDIYYNLVEMAVGCKLDGGLRHVSKNSDISDVAADDLAVKRQQRAHAGGGLGEG